MVPGETATPELSEEEFVRRATLRPRKPPRWGIHSVFSGFTEALRAYVGRDPVEATTRLAQEGKLVIRSVCGGVMLFLPEDASPPATPEVVVGRTVGEEAP
jgi:hypothetical protein